jgi:anti-sigma B factor antagonist
MELEHRIVENILVVKLKGETLDSRSAQEFQKQIFDLIQNEHYHLLLNLKKIQFIDSSGLGAIVTILKKILPDSALKLCGLNKNVAFAFEITNLHKIFDIYESQATALQAFQKENRILA